MHRRLSTSSSKRNNTHGDNDRAHWLRGRRVRFSEHPTFHSPPRTPSPTFSLSTVPSDAGPPTPPSAQPGLPHAPFDVVFQPVLLHPILQAPEDDPSGNAAWRNSSPLAAFDMSRSPDAIPRIRSAPGGAPGHWSVHAAEPATHPPLHTLVLVHDLLPYPIFVIPDTSSLPASPTGVTFHPSTTAPESASSSAVLPPFTASVTVADVLHTLHRFLRTPLAPAEVSALSFASAARADAAFEERCGRSERERERGMRRIDLLFGETKFVGLKATKRVDVWVLCTAEED